MNSYIKHIIEGFDFNSASKLKKPINAHDILFEEKLNNIVYKIINKPTIGIKDKNFILSLPYNIYKTNDDEIHLLIKKCIKFFGNNCDLNWIDTSKITNMKGLFQDYYEFNGNISNWDVSNVINMEDMFMHSDFNGDISNWDVGNVTDMNGMFCASKFDNDISKWNVSNVKQMIKTFTDSKFNGDISHWDVSNVTSMFCMFTNSKFNGDISHWNVSNVINMRSMFMDSKFNNDISNWDVSNVIDMSMMFDGCSIKEKYMPKNIKGIFKY